MRVIENFKRFFIEKPKLQKQGKSEGEKRGSEDARNCCPYNDIPSLSSSDESYCNGYKTGYKKGWEETKESIKEEGFREGQKQGFADGFKLSNYNDIPSLRLNDEAYCSGYSNGYHDGYGNGEYKKGFDDGKKKGSLDSIELMEYNDVPSRMVGNESYHKGYVAGYNEGYGNDDALSEISADSQTPDELKKNLVEMKKKRQRAEEHLATMQGVVDKQYEIKRKVSLLRGYVYNFAEAMRKNEDYELIRLKDFEDCLSVFKTAEKYMPTEIYEEIRELCDLFVGCIKEKLSSCSESEKLLFSSLQNSFQKFLSCDHESSYPDGIQKTCLDDMRRRIFMLDEKILDINKRIAELEGKQQAREIEQQSMEKEQQTREVKQQPRKTKQQPRKTKQQPRSQPHDYDSGEGNDGNDYDEVKAEDVIVRTDEVTAEDVIVRKYNPPQSMLDEFFDDYSDWDSDDVMDDEDDIHDLLSDWNDFLEEEEEDDDDDDDDDDD